ncbi:MAG: hypothetical protein ACRDK8_07660 [Solirubrobacteraceae bacterium]
MPRVPAEAMSGGAVIETNAGEDSSPSAFRALFAEVFEGRELELESIEAVDALRTIRADARA